MSEIITPTHISELMSTDRIVVRYYCGKRRIAKLEFTPKTLEEYLQALSTPHLRVKGEVDE